MQDKEKTFIEKTIQEEVIECMNSVGDASSLTNLK